MEFQLLGRVQLSHNNVSVPTWSGEAEMRSAMILAVSI